MLQATLALSEIQDLKSNNHVSILIYEFVWFYSIILKSKSLQHGNNFFKLVLVSLAILYMAVIISNFYNIDTIIILEHSFHLAQQNVPQPVSSAAQKYNVSNTSARVQEALKGVFNQYSKISDREKADMIFNVISQNRMGKQNTCFILCSSITLFFRDSSSYMKAISWYQAMISMVDVDLE